MVSSDATPLQEAGGSDGAAPGPSDWGLAHALLNLLVLLDLGKAEVPPVLGRPLADGGGDVELLGRRVAGGRGSSGPELDGEGHGRLLLGVRVHLLAPAAILGGRRGAGGGGGVRVGLGERRRGGRAGGGRGGAGLLGALRLGLGWGVAAQLPLRVLAAGVGDGGRGAPEAPGGPPGRLLQEPPAPVGVGGHGDAGRGVARGRQAAAREHHLGLGEAGRRRRRRRVVQGELPRRRLSHLPAVPPRRRPLQARHAGRRRRVTCAPPVGEDRQRDLPSCGLGSPPPVSTGLPFGQVVLWLLPRDGADNLGGRGLGGRVGCPREFTATRVRASSSRRGVSCERVLGEGRAKAGVAKALRQGSVIAVVQVLEEQQVLLLEVAQFPPGGVGVRVGRGLAAAGVRAAGAVEAVAVGAVRVLQDLAQANASAVARILVEGGRAGSSVILVRGGLGRKGESRERERVPQGSPLGGGALRACASQP